MGKTITNGELSGLAMELSMLLHAGTGVGDALSMLSQEDGYQDLLAGMARRADEGAPLSQCLREGGRIPAYVCGLVEVGEETGRTEEALSALSRYYERRARLDRQVRGALLYPAVMLVLMLLVIAVLLVRVLPIFDDVYASLGGRLTGVAGGLLALGRGLDAAMPVLWVVLAVAVGFFAAFAGVESFRGEVLAAWRRGRGDKGVSRRMNNARLAGAQAAQGYRDSKNPTDTPISGCYSIYYWMVNRFYSQARSGLRLNAIVNGSGFMVSMKLLRRQGGWKTATLTEDIEFSALCALRGDRIYWVPEAVIFDEQPLTFALSWKQRKRWSTGMVQCMERYAVPLLSRAARGNLFSLDSLLFFILPVVQVLGLLAMAGGAVFDLLGISYGLFPVTSLFHQIFFAVNLSFFTTFLGALLAVAANGKPIRPMLPAMIWYWLFIMSWMPLNLLCLVRRSTVWEAIPHTRALSLSQVQGLR